MSANTTMLPVRHGWTFEDLAEIPDEDWRRYEIVDGALVVSPSATPRHELASARVRAAILTTLGRDLEVIGPIGLDLGTSYRVPDLAVVPMRVFANDVPLLQPSDVLLVVEVVSPGSVTTDRITKPAQYAAAGIPAFWRVETDPVALTAYTLPDGASVYTELGSWGRGETAHLAEPFPVAISLDELAPPE